MRLAYELAFGFMKLGYRVTVVCEDLHGCGLEKQELEGITVLRYRLPPSRCFDPFRHVKHIRAIDDLMQKYVPEPPDIIHGHSLFQYVAVLRRFGANVRCLYTVHSPAVEELPIVWNAQGSVGRIKTLAALPIIRRLERECLCGSDSITAESFYTEKLMLAHYGSGISSRVKVIPGWIKLQRFTPLHKEQGREVREKFGWSTELPVFFVLRRLEAQMGFGHSFKRVDHCEATWL